MTVSVTGSWHNGRERLSGTVEVDEFVIGGQKPGKRGRGANGKTIVVAAVEKQVKKLGRIRLQVVPDCSGDVLEQFISANVIPESTVVTDGWRGYNFLDKSSHMHDQIVASRTPKKDSVLPGVHLIASLVKRLILGTFQGRFAPEHLQSYLDEYVWEHYQFVNKKVFYSDIWLFLYLSKILS